MRVLMLSSDPNIFSVKGGVRQRMEEYAALFDELYVVAPAKRGAKKIVQKNLFLYPAISSFGLRWRWEMYRIASAVCSKSAPHVISAQSPDELGLIGFYLSRKFGSKFQLQIHADVMSPWYRMGSLKDKIRYLMARFLIPRADCIRVVSERIRDSILWRFNLHNLSKEVGQPQINILPIFTEISKFLNASRDSKIDERFKNFDFKIIAVGRFVDKEKNFSMLIDMMRDFIRICPKALLVLVGEGPDRENYKLRTMSYKLEKNVIIEPWRDDLPRFYKSFDLYLMSSNYEGWGRTVIEAMASGLPVIMTDVGLAGGVVNPVRSQSSRHGVGTADAPQAHRTSNGVKNGDNGVVVPVADKTAMLQAVTDLYQNRELRAKFSEAGLATVQNLEPKTKVKYLLRYKESFNRCLQKF